MVSLTSNLVNGAAECLGTCDVLPGSTMFVTFASRNYLRQDVICDKFIGFYWPVCKMGYPCNLIVSQFLIVFPILKLVICI